MPHQILRLFARVGLRYRKSVDPSDDSRRVRPAAVSWRFGLPEGIDWEDLRRQLERAVRTVCPYYLTDRQDDIVQEAVMKVMGLVERADEAPETFTASYLRRVAYTALVDEIRRLRRDTEMPYDPNDPEQPDHPSDDPSALRLAMSAETRAAILECVGRLAASRRRAVQLKLQGIPVPRLQRSWSGPTRRPETIVIEAWPISKPVYGVEESSCELSYWSF